MKKIAVTSDLHGNLPEIDECDILCICGDIIPLDIQWKEKESLEWIENDFIPWTKTCKAKKVVFIAGNHDAWFYWHRKEDLYSFFAQYGLIYLQDMVALVDGVSIYGTPWCKPFGNWAFMRDYEELAIKYSNIPEKVDILLSHDAPMIEEFGIIHEGEYAPVNAGNIVLADCIEGKKPRYAFCGHIHSGDHNFHKVGDTYIANVSYVDESYNPINSVFYAEISTIMDTTANSDVSV